MSANRRLGESGPLQKEKKIDFTRSKNEETKKAFAKITETLPASKGSAGEDGPSQGY